MESKKIKEYIDWIDENISVRKQKADYFHDTKTNASEMIALRREINIFKKAKRKFEILNNTIFTEICCARKFKTKYKSGDKVEIENYVSNVILQEIDKHETLISKKLHWNVLSESFLIGRSKTNYDEPISEDEIIKIID